MASFNFISGDTATQASEVTDAHFGAIYTTFHGLGSFTYQASLLGVKSLRWPGGTRGEMALDSNDRDNDGDTTEYLFDLGHEDLITIDGKGLSDMLIAASELDAELAIFLPSIRYLDDPDAGAVAAEAFMVRLLAGEFGSLPKKLTIELGNESLDGTAERADAYGQVADAMISGIAAAFDESGTPNTEISIGIQIGRSFEEDAAIRDSIGTENLGLIDTLITHHLPINLRNHNRTLETESDVDTGDSRFTRSTDYIEAWSAAVAAAGGGDYTELDHFVSAWTVGPSSDITGHALDYYDLGARQGRTTVDTFVQLVGAGADAASLWGIDARSNPNFYSTLEDGEIELSHGGIAFQMMAESLVGSTLLANFTQPLDASGYPTADGWVYGFENDVSYTLFVVANDIDAAAVFSLSLEDVDVTRDVEVKRLHTEDAGGDRLSERPKVEEYLFELEEPEFDFALTQDFEVNRLIIWKTQDDVAGAADDSPVADEDGDMPISFYEEYACNFEPDIKLETSEFLL